MLFAVLAVGLAWCGFRFCLYLCMRNFLLRFTLVSFRLVGRGVRMPKVLCGFDMISDALLQDFGLRKPAFRLAVPEQNTTWLRFSTGFVQLLRCVCQGDLEEATGCRNQCYLPYGGLEG